MGGFGHCPVHIEVKNGFCAASALLRQTPPAGTAHPLRAIADKAVADEIDIDVSVGRPMPLEIVEISAIFIAGISSGKLRGLYGGVVLPLRLAITLQ